jgi:radical SAM superfamily enzyme YgiQ (UPF0313 family)
LGVDEETLQLMKKGGCIFINYGFESMNADVLKEMNKNTTPEDNENAAKLTAETNIAFGANFIWGFSSDTLDTLWENVDFIKKYNLYGQVRTIRPVTPYPGCPLYYEAIEKGLIEGPEDFYNKFKNSDLITVNFMDMDLKTMYNNLYKANSELIDDHYLNTSMTKEECERLKNSYYQLYFEGKTSFRGVRSYAKKN